MNGQSLPRNLFQPGFLRHGDVDVEARFTQFTGQDHTVLQKVLDLVINDEKSWCGARRRLGMVSDRRQLEHHGDSTPVKTTPRRGANATTETTAYPRSESTARQLC